MGIKIVVFDEGDKEFKSLVKKALNTFDGRLNLKFENRCQLKDGYIAGEKKADIVIINADKFHFRMECPACFNALSAPREENASHIMMLTNKFSVESFLFNQQRGITETVDIRPGPENLIHAVSSIIKTPP